MTLYVIHARRTGSPVLDFSLLRLPTMRAAIIGGFLFRLGIGALPFLLPLLMQVGFGLSPFQSGLVTFASAVGAMGMKTLAARIIRAFGFRNMMTVNALISAAFLAACALFTATTPLAADHAHPGGRRLLPLAGVHRDQHGRLCRGRAGADEPRHHASSASTSSLAVSAGVAVGAFSVRSTLWVRHLTELSADVFAPAFLVVSLISAASSISSGRCRSDAGHEISGRKAMAISSRKGAAKGAAQEATVVATEGTQDMRDQRLG